MLKRSKAKVLPIHADLNGSQFPLINPAFWVPVALTLLLLLPLSSRGEDKKSAREEGQFDIFVDGKEIGHEKFTIITSADSISSNSTLNFRNLGPKQQNVRLETQLNMDGQYVPKAYKLQSDVDGQKGTITGTFVPNEARFEYQGSGDPKLRGLPVGDRYLILDTNVFHHFTFIARQFNFGSGKSQSYEAVIPQELDSGIVKVSEVGLEIIPVKGKKRELHHLRADTGLFVIDLWVDDNRILYKIALPLKKIEVVRG